VTRLPGPLFQIFRQAKAHQQAGRLNEAAQLYRHVLSAEPSHAHSLYQLGSIAVQFGRLDIAVEQIQRAVSLDPRSAEYHRGLGFALESMARTEDAIPHYREALKQDPKNTATLTSLGSALARTGRFAEAEPHFRAVLRRHPKLAEAHGNLGNLLLGLGRLADAEAAFRRACELDPGSAASHADLANVLHGLGRLEAAAEAARKAASLGPDLPAAHHVLGNILAAQARMTDAAAAYGEALRLQPSAPLTQHNLGNVLGSIGRASEADRCYRLARRDAPGFAMAHSSLLLNLNYLPDRSADSVAAEHRLWDMVHGGAVDTRPRTYETDLSIDRRLRIGYVSGDFRHHPVGYFIEPLLDRHDHIQNEIFCYARVGRPDDFTDRLRPLADHWISILELSETAAADRIRDDRIDILIDLAGHTNGGQMLLFARKPAPIQASWLGYPHSTGLRAIDYRISDPIADPPNPSDPPQGERIERLVGGFLCYRPPGDAPGVVLPPVLRNDHITFGSFNNLAKFNAAMLARWAAILRAVPGSRLLLKAGPFVDPTVRGAYQDAFAGQGIGPERLDLRAATLPMGEHLGLYGEIDIALDPDPYNGTTTSCEALWMGVPVVTLRGTRHASRVGASLLTGLGLTDLVAADADSYVETAVRIARDIDRLARLRTGLRATMRASPLMDEPGFARGMEQVYRRIWRRHCDAALK
jgi:protein O-GlcNAc transferase